MDKITMVGFGSFALIGGTLCGLALARHLCGSSPVLPGGFKVAAARMRRLGWEARGVHGSWHAVSARDVTEAVDLFGRVRHFRLGAYAIPDAPTGIKIGRR